MKGFVLAAGMGERLRPLTAQSPKPLLPVMNIPSICYSLLLLRQAGITDIVCNLHYRHRDIIDFFERHGDFGMNVTFSFEPDILGTGGGVKNCERCLNGEEFVLVNSDIILDIDVREAINAHRQSGASGTVVLYPHDNASMIAPVSVKDGKVLDFKNFLNTGVGGRHIYTGLAVLTPDIFPYLTIEHSSIVYTGYVGLIRHHRLGCFIHQGRWFDIGTPRGYYDVNMELMRQPGGFPGLFRSHFGLPFAPVSATAVVSDGAVVESSILGEGSSVGAGAIVRRVVALPGSTVPDLSHIEHSIVYDGAIIPS